MKYVEYPNNANKNIIQNYWKFEILENADFDFPIQHETLPENAISLVLINQPYFKGIRLLGPHIKSYKQAIMANSIFFGIKFQPWITIKKLVPNKASILNATCDVPEPIKSYFENINFETLKPGFKDIQIIDKSVRHLLNELNIQSHDMVKFICLQLNNGEKISEIVHQIPASIRIIQKQFKEITGLTMKQYATVNRQRNTWKSIVIDRQKPTDALYDHGYFDQSHFINEFKKVMVQSPRDFKEHLSSVDMDFK